MPTTVDLSGASLPPSARKAWKSFNAGRPAHPYRDVFERFQCARAQFPTAPAVADEVESLDYTELDNRSRAVANRLSAEGVRPGDHVALVDERDVGTYVFLLAIIRLNAVFVPLDARDSIQRVTAALEMSSVSWLVTAPGRQEAIGKATEHTRIICVDWRTEDALDWDDSSPSPGDLAYIIHTSGSTGTPKGVRISHRSLSNLIDWVLTDCPIKPYDVVAQMSPLYFDPSVQQIFPAWSTGACVVPVPLRLLLEPIDLISWLRDHRVTHVDLVTPHWISILTALESLNAAVLPCLPDMKWLLIGGESMYYEQVARWNAVLDTDAKIVNIYGPTEATVNASTYPTYAEVSQGKVPIGHPLPGYLLYTVDANQRLCNPYAVGELVIAGIGVADGYTDQARTEIAFATDKSGGIPGLIYRTGDQARLIRDHFGQWVLEFRGRTDDQVKIAGNRVELEEIDAALVQSPYITDGAVVVNGTGAAKSVVCLYIADTDAQSQVERQLRDHLKASLPSYMVPSRFHQVSSLIYKDTGKLDRVALLQQFQEIEERSRYPVTSSSFEDELSQTVRSTWSEVLKRPDLAADADFFTNGGSSLLALETAARLRQQLSLPVRTLDIYQNSTLREFIEWARNDGPDAEASANTRDVAPGSAIVVTAADSQDLLALLNRPLEAVAKNERIEIMPSAAGLADEFVPVHLAIDGYSHEMVAGAVADLVALHPLLRSTPDETKRTWRWIQTPQEMVIPILSVADKKLDSTLRAIHQAVSLGEEQSGSHPCKAAIVRASTTTYLLMWIGHAVCDGESQVVILDEFVSCLRARSQQSSWPPVRDHGQHDQYVRQILQRTYPAALEAERSIVREFDTARWLFAVHTRSASQSPRLYRYQIDSDAPYALAIALSAISINCDTHALPILVDFHGRVEPQVHSLVGSFSTYIPGVLNLTKQDTRSVESTLRSFLQSLPSRYPGSVQIRPRTTKGAIRISIFQETGSNPAKGLQVPESIVPESDGDGHLDVSIRVDDNGVQLIISTEVDLQRAAQQIETELAGANLSEGES